MTRPLFDLSSRKLRDLHGPRSHVPMGRFLGDPREEIERAHLASEPLCSPAPAKLQEKVFSHIAHLGPTALVQDLPKKAGSQPELPFDVISIR